MLGRKDYKKEELDNASTAIHKQIAAYKKLVKAIDNAKSDAKVTAALEDFDALFFNNMTMVLDRYFVHRLRGSAGKDGNPLNEVELMVDSLINNNGVLQGNNVVKYEPEDSVVKLKIGDRIKLSLAEFESLSKGFFASIEEKFI